MSLPVGSEDHSTQQKTQGPRDFSSALFSLIIAGILLVICDLASIFNFIEDLSTLQVIGAILIVVPQLLYECLLIKLGK